MFILDVLLNGIGYGMLYMKRVFTPVEVILTLANIALIVRMVTDWNKSKSLFGVKMLCAVTLLILRLDTLRQNFNKLCKRMDEDDVQRIHPESHLVSHNDTINSKNNNQMGVVSVR